MTSGTMTIMFVQPFGLSVKMMHHYTNELTFHKGIKVFHILNMQSSGYALTCEKGIGSKFIMTVSVRTENISPFILLGYLSLQSW